jgi:putative Holliday junction resolvase
MRYLAVDFGLKRIGLAVSDASERMAFPLKTLYKSTNDQLFAELVAIIRDEGIGGLVVGVPRDLEGRTTMSTRQAENFASKLRSRTGLEVSLIDETLTSAVAEEKLKESGIAPDRRKACLDQQAAVEILNTFLQNRGSCRDRTGSPEVWPD